MKNIITSPYFAIGFFNYNKMLTEIRPLGVFLGKTKFIGCSSSISFIWYQFTLSLCSKVSIRILSVLNKSLKSIRFKRSVVFTIRKTYDLSSMFKSIYILNFILIFPRRKWWSSKSTIFFPENDYGLSFSRFQKNCMIFQGLFCFLACIIQCFYSVTQFCRNASNGTF